MSATTMGFVGEYDEAVEEFAFYSERLVHFFEANQVAVDRQVSVFLASIGPKTYKLLRNLLQPELPKSKSFLFLIDVLKAYYKPTPNVIAERLRFHMRNQRVDETLSDYIVELKRLSSTCDFTSFLDDALRDRLVCGLRSETIRKMLVNKRELKFQEACETALSTELVDRDLAELNVANNGTKINAISREASLINAVSNVKSFDRNSDMKCFRCGGHHLANVCKYIQATCHKCDKIGHISPVCQSRKIIKNKFRSRSKFEDDKNNKLVELEDTSEFHDMNLFGISIPERTFKHEYPVPVEITGVPLIMELDTAADVSTVGEIWFKQHFPTVTLHEPSSKLRGYGGEQIPVLGQTLVEVKYAGQVYSLPLYIIVGDKAPLFGKNWLKEIKLNFREIFMVKNGESLQKLLSEFKKLFVPSHRPIKKFKADIMIQKDSHPVFRKARPVPYALKNSVEQEIQKSIKLNIWHRVEHSKWATPVVIVPKKTGNVRLCGDFKVTLNPIMDVNQYPLPTQQDLFATLSGGRYFSKLDLSGAYQQVELEKHAQEMMTLNTHLGLMRPTRLLYGISSAAAIFQSVIDKILNGLESTIAFQDDILVTGSTREVHLENLRKVFTRLYEYGVGLNQEKCSFLQESVEYLGHIIDAEGVHPTNEKIEAISNVSAPKDVSELRAFLGLLNYYSKFLKNTSTLLAPLHKLLTKNQKWDWTPECAATFQSCKGLLTSDAVLVHYNTELPLKLSCDASPVGLGVVLSHILNSGQEKPIAYASRSLSQSEANYSQVEKEALSIIFGIRKFEQYLFGRPFTLVTDHQPLVSIFGPKKGVPVLAAARLQRWALLLANYNYTIEYKKGELHQNADALSRLPYSINYIVESNIYKTSFVHDLPVTATDIMKHTGVDAILGRVINYIQHGWPKDIPVELHPYSSRRDELAVDTGCVMWGRRVVIPKKLQDRMLELLHDVHPGIVKMKSIARSYFWWPLMDNDIENCGRSCTACTMTQRDPPTVPLQSWIWPKGPMDRIHIDFAQSGSDHFLVCIDSHSKWMEVVKMSSTTSVNTMAELRNIFARYGLPLELVSDNGSQLCSSEFEMFLKYNGIKHTLIPMYHPSSNGAAERSVQTFKLALRKMNSDISDNSSLQCRIARFLFQYRTTPQATTGVSPSELFIGRQLRTRLSLIRPNIACDVAKHQMKQKLNHDHGNTSVRTFSVGQQVLVREYSQGKCRWTSGVIVEVQSSRTFIVLVGDHRRSIHIDQIRNAYESDTSIPVSKPNTALTDGGIEDYVKEPSPHIPAPREQCEAENTSIITTPLQADTTLGPRDQNDPSEVDMVIKDRRTTQVKEKIAIIIMGIETTKGHSVTTDRMVNNPEDHGIRTKE